MKTYMKIFFLILIDICSANKIFEMNFIMLIFNKKKKETEEHKTNNEKQNRIKQSEATKQQQQEKEEEKPKYSCICFLDKKKRRE